MKPPARPARLLALTLLTAAALWAHALAQMPARPGRWLDATASNGLDTAADTPNGCRGDDDAWLR